MFNPFVPFHIRMIDSLRQIGHRYIVTQTFHHALDSSTADPRLPLLLSDYKDVHTATVHFRALDDPYRAILDLEREDHRAKITGMLDPGSRYQLWAAFIQDRRQVEQRLNEQYSAQIRNYVARNTDWRVGSDRTLRPRLQMIFGELFVILKYGQQTEQFRLSELDRY